MYLRSMISPFSGRIKGFCGILILLFALVSCDIDGNNYGTDDYYKASVSVKYSQSPLLITVNGKKYENIDYQKEEDGHLSVYSQDSTVLLLDTIISIKYPIQLIQLSDGKVNIYHKDDYLSFNANIVLKKGFYVSLGNQKIKSGLNYIKKTDANESISYYKEGSNTPITSEYIKLSEGITLLFLQVNDSSFLSLQNTASTEPAPSPNHTKIQFLYSPDENDPEAIELEFWGYDADTQQIFEDYKKTIVLEKNKLSSFIDFDLNFIEGGTRYTYTVYEYDLKANQRGNELINYYDNYDGDISGVGRYNFRILHILGSSRNYGTASVPLLEW